MKQLSITFLLIASLLLSSCSNANKSNDAAQTDAIDMDGQSKDNGNSENPPSDFQKLTDGIVSNNSKIYDQHVDSINNIDTLVLYKFDNEEYSYYSLLGLACRTNNLHAMKDLIMRGADIKTGSKDDFSVYDALYHTILGGNAEMVKILIDKGANPNGLYTSIGVSPLVLCTMNKKYMMAEILLKAGAKVNGFEKMGYTLIPLHEAIKREDIEMVKILLKYNASISLKDSEEQNALSIGQYVKDKEIIQLVKNHEER